jgi:hypothetical protein
MKLFDHLPLSNVQHKWHLLILSVLSIALRWYIPLYPKYGSLHDDQLLVGVANSMIRGEWMGDFVLSQGRVLSKPPGYSMFLYLAHFFPLPSTVLLQVIIVSAALVINAQLIFFGVKKSVGLTGFVATIFLPIWFGGEASRLYRDFYLSALLLLIIALNLLLIRWACFDNLFVNATKRKRQKFYLLVFTVGLLCSNVIVTKNIGFAPIVFSVIILGVCLSKGFFSKQISLRFIAICLAIFTVGTLVLVTSVKIVNKRVYGVAVTNNFTEGEFPKAMNLMASVKSGKPRPYVLVTKEMRRAMYVVSPTMKKLEFFLDRPEGTIWRSFSCLSPMEICDESALWFPWEIRDAVQQAGLASSAIDFEHTFKLIADEIQYACDQKLLTCGRKGLAPQIGAWDSISKRHLLESTSTLISGLFELKGGGGTVLGYAQDLSKQDFEMWDQTVNGIVKNVPANDVVPYIKSGSFTVNGLGSIFALPWRMFFLTGLIGYFVALLKKRRTCLLFIGLTGFVPLFGLIVQLAISDTQTGLYASLPPYYLPMYPFLLFSLTIGLNVILSETAVLKYFIATEGRNLESD